MSQQSNENEQVLRWKNARERLAERAQDVRNATAAPHGTEENLSTQLAAKLATSLYSRACEEYVAAYQALPERMR